MLQRGYSTITTPSATFSFSGIDLGFCVAAAVAHGGFSVSYESWSIPLAHLATL